MGKLFLPVDQAWKPEELETKFRLSLESFSLFAARFTLEIEPHCEQTWIKFRSLDSVAQQAAYDSFMAYFNLCVAAAESGVAMNDDRSLAWWAVQKFGLRPCSDFFDKLEHDQVLELYNRSFVQIFRNWAFFKISSYSMGDLFVHPWPELYVRDEAVTNNLIAYATHVLSGSQKSTLICESPRHIVTESLSKDRNVLEMEMKFASPLFDQDGQVAAFFAISSVRKIGRNSSVHHFDTPILDLV